MAFDVNNPADLAALKSEVNTDPTSMGYAAVVNQTTLLLKLLNDPANNVGGETAATPLTPKVLLDVVDGAEYAGNQVAEGRGLFDLFAGLINSDPEFDLEQYRTKIKDIFPTNGPTNAAIDALTSALSRAEVLFGQGTVISRNDWFAARDS